MDELFTVEQDRQMKWDEDCRAWYAIRANPSRDAGRQLYEIVKRAAQATSSDWSWFAAAFDDPRRKLFAAAVFEIRPVPKALVESMLRAGVYERDPSWNQVYIKPCVKSFGAERVLKVLLRYLESGTNFEKAGAVSAMYWVRENPEDEDAELRATIERRMLREFVENADLHVRQRILPSLHLKPEAYPTELQPLVLQAVRIARSHPDEYLRHRVEIQLGSRGPLMPLPKTRST